MKVSTRLAYLAESALKMALRKGLRCPSCASNHSSLMDSKYLVTQLRRCQQCRLLYRIPTTSEKDAEVFYQSSYQEGFTTTTPSAEQLKELLASNFKGSEKDYTAYIDVMCALNISSGAKVLDFGCSWGYGTLQLTRVGFAVQGYEISETRCRFARDTLGVDARSDWERLEGPYDVIFSSHVLEHLPDVAASLRKMWEKLARGGILLAFTPNGSLSRRTRAPHAWHQAWGYVHGSLMDEEFYRQHFKGVARLVATTPYPHRIIGEWRSVGKGVTECDLSGAELLAVALKAH